jgi:hypothetical protein
MIDPPLGAASAASCFSRPTMRNATVAVAGCCWWSGLAIVGIFFWLIESRELVIELAHQLGNPFG